VITAIAAAHGVSAAQVLLAWGIACGTCVIPKSVNPERQAANLQAATAPRLSAAELERIAGLDRPPRSIDGSFWELPGGPYTRANLWDEPATA
jgi:alcohol dehydrogenase (NADP+)